MKRKKKIARNRPRLSVTLSRSTLKSLNELTLAPNGIDRHSRSVAVDIAVSFYHSAKEAARRKGKLSVFDLLALTPEEAGSVTGTAS